MIIHLKDNVSAKQAEILARDLSAILLREGSKTILVSSSKMREVPDSIEKFVEEYFVFESDIQLANNQYRSKRTIQVGTDTIGQSNITTLIAGPCSVESEEQMELVARFLSSLGVKYLRAGCFKPRTSPYTFQGMGAEGLKILEGIRNKYGMHIVTEVRDGSHADDVIASADIVQIGAKAMYDQSVLRKCGQSDKPILLKRGFGTTLQEFVQAAEFILSSGNNKVMLCERGIRTFETKTRFTLDLTGVAYLKYHTNLPILVDPSHAMGYRYGVPDLARAAMAMGIDGLLIETHPQPEKALSDASQQLNFDEFRGMYESLLPIAGAVGKTLD